MDADPAQTPDEAAQRAFGQQPAPAAPTDAALADWWPRAAALVLDGLVTGAVGLGLAALAIALTGGDPGGTTSKILVYAIAIPLGLAYAPLLMMRRGPHNGQTLGKQAMGLRVVRLDGEPVTLGTGLLREVIGRQLLILITVYVYALFDYLWPLWDARNQCLHDKVASTLVVRTTAAPATSHPPPRPAPPPPELSDEPVAGWLPPRAGA